MGGRGRVRVNTGDGRVRVADFDGEAAVETGDGRITLEGDFTQLSARTGDGAISLPIMRAVARRHPGLVALHIDSHTDAKPWREADGHDSGNQFTAAAREGLVDAARSWHVGIRGTIHAAGRVLSHSTDFPFL